MKRIVPVAALVAGTLAALPAAAADTISAVYAFPKTVVYSKSFIDFVEKANAAGKGVFTIQLRGGPEAIGMFQQGNAVRDGVVDMIYGPCSFYAAALPECDAMVATTIDGPTARKNGGWDLFNQIHQKRMGVYYLGWMDSGIKFNIWTIKEPKFDAQGSLDLRGVKLRGNPIYNAFFEKTLGASPITIPSTELYTALERGTVDASGWTQIGIMDLNWDKYLKFRVEPAFFSTDLGVVVNLKKWNALSAKTREILQQQAIAHEVASMKALADLRVKEFAELEKRGIKVVSMSPEAGKRYLAGARASTLERMKERVEKAGGMENYDRMIQLFTPN